MKMLFIAFALLLVANAGNAQAKKPGTIQVNRIVLEPGNETLPDITLTQEDLDSLLSWMKMPQGSGSGVVKDTMKLFINPKIKFVQIKKDLYKIVNGKLVKVK